MPALKDLKNGSLPHGTNIKQKLMKVQHKNSLELSQYIYLVCPDSISHAAVKKNIHSNALSGSAAAMLEIRCNPKCSSSGCGVPHKARQSEADCPLKQMHSSQLNVKGVCGGVELN